MLNQRQLPYLLLLPSVLFLLAFFIWPLIEAALIALQNASGEWSLENFREMADDLNFTDALKNTLLLVIVIVPLQLMIALGLAMLLRQLGTGRDIYLYIWTIPLGVSDLAAGIVWLSLLSERGYLNTVLYYLGVIDDPALWLSYETPVALFVAVVLAEIWRATALILVILVAGMQLIPREYGEAAEIFGATAWKRFTRVTLPLLKPSVQTALILRTILAFEVFAVVVALGGRDLPVLVGEAYFWQYDYQNTGVASAYAVLILLVSVVATVFYLRLLKVRPEQMG
jgi:multiple sugar transport system permease protein